MTGDGWAPTHRVPDGGLPSWAAPDANPEPRPALDAGLEVVMMERRAEWAQVRCENGWVTWVDGRTLISLAPTSGPAKPKRRLIAGAVVAVALVGAGIGAVVLSGDDDSGPTTTVATAPRVALQVPAGWSVSPDGLTVAQRAEDLRAPLTGGPRVRAITDLTTDHEKMLREAEVDRPPVRILAAPEDTTVAGRSAIGITLREEEHNLVFVRRYLAAKGATGVPVLFILEAPEAQYDAAAAVLAGVPGWSA